MNQIFGFKKKFEYPILTGRKIYTTRKYTPFRDKCNIGDIIYLYTGIRTKEANKFGEAKIIGKWRWKIEIPKDCPIPNEDWFLFAISEGFLDVDGFKQWFESDLITYKFELLGLEGRSK